MARLQHGRCKKKNIEDYVARLIGGNKDNADQEQECKLCKMARGTGVACDDCPLETEEVFEIWPENVQTIALFSDCISQFQRGAHGEVWGLDFKAVELIARWTNVEIDERIFRGLKDCEQAYISAMGELIKDGRDSKHRDSKS